MYMLDLEKKLEKDNKYKTDQEITIKVALKNMFEVKATLTTSNMMVPAPTMMIRTKPRCFGNNW